MKISKFQIIVLAFFVVCIVAGVIFFATYKGSGSTGTDSVTVSIWGTFPAEAFNSYVNKLSLTLPQKINVKYTQKDPATFSQEFNAAASRGKGPDALLIPADMLLPQFGVITLIPYSVLDQRTFKDTFIQEGEIYLTDSGILAIPFTVDPLVMYWNRDLFSSAGVATYPKYWDEFSALNKKLTIKDDNGNIRRSTIAMGDFTNISNARELLGTLFMQVGNPVVARASDGSIASTLKTSIASDSSPAVRFFTQFVDPNNTNYSWNRGMPDSKTAFISGNLATYFGFTSELRDIRAKNPNLNFDVASMPQARTEGVKATYGRLYGLSIVSSSPNQNAVYQDIIALANAANMDILNQAMYLPSTNRATIAAGSSDPYINVFDSAALISKTWFDADQSKSFKIFSGMIDAVTSGSKSVSEAVNDAGDQYDALLKSITQ
ncbi:MAG: extracellular solute-binding protein [Candidatus Taylorbacteria bacterium]|nr:extracellular solute-binding protein [Candidatus Taylorbacteria bacterium]